MIVSKSARWIARIILIITTLLVVFPFIYQLGMSLKPENTVFSTPLSIITFPPSLANFRVVLAEVPLLRYLGNSLVFALGVTLGQLLLALPAAYAFACFDFPLKNSLLALVLLSLLVPFVVTYIPNYLLLASWGLINTRIGMILPMLGVSLGFGIFLLRQHFMSFPKSILEAAIIDGANSWQVLWRVLAPANIAAIIAVGVYVLISAWNQFIWPLLVGGGRPDMYTLTVGVQMYYTNAEGGNSWGALMAASILTSLPTLIMYALMRKGILRTFSEGAVK